MTILSKKKKNNEKRENDLENSRTVRAEPNTRSVRSSPPTASATSSNTNRWNTTTDSLDNQNDLNDSSNELQNNQNTNNKRKIHTNTSPQHRSVRTRSSNTSPTAKVDNNISSDDDENEVEDDDASSSPINSEDEYKGGYGNDGPRNLFNDAEKFLEVIFRSAKNLLPTFL